jgi:Xaa-Pro aminopeptidase
MNYGDRVTNLQYTLRDVADFFVTSHLPNVRYLTGFSGSNGTVLISAAGEVWLFTDGRYTNQAEVEATYSNLVIERNSLEAVKEIVQKAFKTLAFESQHLSVSSLSVFQGLDVKPTVNLVEDLRMVKEPAEISAVRTACEITSNAWQTIIETSLLGRTELDIAGALEHEFRMLGATDRAFDSIVASGSNSAIPHHQPSTRRIQSGDFLKIDCGALVDGYHADMTRTVVVGKADSWQSEIYEIVSQSAAATRAAAVIGAEVADLDQVARRVIVAAGYGENFVHQTGHGVGLEIHERPFLGRKDGILRSQMLVTIEPGIYLQGRGGVRIEDTILISETGHENLTTANRALLEL